MKPDFKPNKTTKELRQGMIELIPRPALYKIIQDSKISKQQAAEKIFQFTSCGLKAADLCKIYGISIPYYTQLKALNNFEWTNRMLTDDENFVSYHNELISDSEPYKHEPDPEGWDNNKFNNFLSFYIAVVFLTQFNITTKDWFEILKTIFNLFEEERTKKQCT